MLDTFAAFSLVPLVIIVMVLVISAGTLVFEVLMFISAVQNKFITSNARILWLLGMVFIHPFIAIAYYFTDYKKRS